jgi:hypothetical protein
LAAPNAHLYWRPDAARFLPAHLHNLLPPQLRPSPHDGYDRAQPNIATWTGRRGRWTPALDVLSAAATRPSERIDVLRRRRETEQKHAELLALKSQLLLLRMGLLLRRYEHALREDRERGLKAGFRPDLPRWPAGSGRISGQWSGGAGTLPPIDGGADTDRTSPIQLAQGFITITDVFGEPYYQRGGHHEVPQKIYEKWNLPEETRRVFDSATTGKITGRLRTSPDGLPISNEWNRIHRIYTQAVDELAKRFLEINNIRADRMTPEQAYALLKEIRESQDPRIRDVNNAIRMLRRLFRLRTGRGGE